MFTRLPWLGVAGPALVAGELRRIVRAEDRDLALPLAQQLAQPLLVAQPRAAVGLHQPLVGPQPRRAARVADAHLARVEVGVAGVEQPAAVRPDDDAGVAQRVAGQRHEQNLWRQAVQVAHALETEPALAVRAVLPPARDAIPLWRAVAVAADEAVPALAGLPELGLQHVDGGRREVLEPARVVEVEVRGDDVAAGARGEAESLDLPQRRLLLAELDAVRQPEQAAQPL